MNTCISLVLQKLREWFIANQLLFVLSKIEYTAYNVHWAHCVPPKSEMVIILELKAESFDPECLSFENYLFIFTYLNWCSGLSSVDLLKKMGSGLGNLWIFKVKLKADLFFPPPIHFDCENVYTILWPEIPKNAQSWLWSSNMTSLQDWLYKWSFRFCTTAKI